MAFPWWEPVLLLKKLFLIGFINQLCEPGTSIQLLVAFLTCIVFLAFHLLLSPWRRRADQVLEAAASFSLCCLFFGCIIIKIGVFADTIGTTSEGTNLPASFLRNSRVDPESVQNGMLAVSLIVFVLAVLMLVWDSAYAALRCASRTAPAL